MQMIQPKAQAGQNQDDSRQATKPQSHQAKGNEHGKPATDHKAALAKMHPEHVHRLVQDAHAGKFGPEAQKSAQQAMQAPAQPVQGDGDGDEQGAAPAGRNYGAIFNGDTEPDADDQAQAAPANRASIFASRGGM